MNPHLPETGYSFSGAPDRPQQWSDTHGYILHPRLSQSQAVCGGSPQDLPVL